MDENESSAKPMNETFPDRYQNKYFIFLNNFSELFKILNIIKLLKYFIFKKKISELFKCYPIEFDGKFRRK